MSASLLRLTPKEAKALATFIDTGLSISPIIYAGDPDFSAIRRIDDKLRKLLATAKDPA